MTSRDSVVAAPHVERGGVVNVPVSFVETRERIVVPVGIEAVGPAVIEFATLD